MNAVITNAEPARLLGVTVPHLFVVKSGSRIVGAVRRTSSSAYYVVKPVGTSMRAATIIRRFVGH